ncbi:histidine utilization repressor [Oryzibacter oryziterrae]|uniref:histidine utilization repressor n=1 Tax=Oryzibacter oryziterrae TaxID=2766474 RepID=UPI001F014A57|nr:histidine utilization repressor [Oryzibacter oryziterrae]
MSLHQQIRAEIEQHIFSGDWPPGHRIPFEHELTALYGCSRMTVNKVLTELAKSGLIERRRKAGSFVTRPHSQAVVIDIHDIKAEVSSRGLPYHFELTKRSRRRALSADRKRLDVGISDQVLDIECRHFAGGRPFCLESRLINLSVVPEAADETFDDAPPGTWLMRQVPWTEAEHRIRAVGADARAAAALDLPEGTACLVIDRHTWRAEQPVTAVSLIYPGDAHELVARFTPSQT